MGLIKMKNKILVELVVPTIEEKYDVFIPGNKKIGNIINLLAKVVNELSGGYFQENKHLCLYNGNSGNPYNIDELVRCTDIQNGSKLILM